jgi:hypothetical protein
MNYAPCAAKFAPNMNKVAAVVVVLVVLAAAAWYFLAYGPSHRTAQTQTALANGYATEPLKSPFTPGSKTWDAKSGTWTYEYTATVAPPDAVAAAKSQLSASVGYQVVASQPDTSTGTGATLYRDLITEDVALKIAIIPNPAPGGPPTLVTVTLSSLAN